MYIVDKIFEQEYEKSFFDKIEKLNQKIKQEKQKTRIDVDRINKINESKIVAGLFDNIFPFNI